MYNIIFITLIILTSILLINKQEKFMLIKNNKIHKSDQYYTFDYLKDLNTVNKKYIEQKDYSVYDESLKKHYKNINYPY
jgi:hypothetical protein